jgi:hypothetical protein
MKKAAFNRSPMGTRGPAFGGQSYPQILRTTSGAGFNIQQKQHHKDPHSLCARTPRRTAQLNRLARAKAVHKSLGFAPSQAVSFFCTAVTQSLPLQRPYFSYDQHRSNIGILSCTWLVLPMGLLFLSSDARCEPVCNQVRFGVIDARLGNRWAFSFLQLVD